MFQRGDEKYLLRAINRNQTNLFVGAGFSMLAKNKFGNFLPSGTQFAQALWTFLGYTEAYDPSSTLSELYEALLASGKPVKVVSEFLESHLLALHIPPEYDEIAKIYWSRIYTTNIDNLLEQIYVRVGSPRLGITSFPKDEVPDRDMLLDRIQAIHLHGRLPCDPKDVTFSISQFARRATPHDHLYDHFVRDYATKTTVFIGTALNEPLLWQYIEVRKAKRPDISEERPKSFLIIPAITAPKRQLLEAMNVTPVLGTARDFLAWIASKSDQISSRDDVLRLTIPGLVELVGGVAIGHENDLRAVQEFGRNFHTIPTDPGTALGERSLFLLGASPKWEDLLCQRDAPREITAAIHEKIERCLVDSPNSASLFLLLGSAGCGKSTLLRRAAIQLARSGYSCFLTNSEELSRFGDISRALNHIGKKCVLFFDNAEAILAALPRLLEEFVKVDFPPVCVVASRINEFERIAPRLPKEVEVNEFLVPNLSRNEIRGVLEVLEKANLLGQLKGMSLTDRVREFESKANKQLLVAMREATSGRGFNDIIESEFRSLTPEETQSLYLCVALATEAGYRLTLQEFVGCSRLSPAESLSILSRNLRDIVLRTGGNDDLLMLRHRKIAEHMVNRAVPRAKLQDAYLRLLDVLASEIGGKPRRSRTFSLFKALIHHHTLFRRFDEDIAQARAIYDSMLTKFSDNAQFLLQYGSLEMEAGNLEVAQNYLNQADSLDLGNPFIANAKGQLFLKQAIKASNKSTAIELRDEGSKILMLNISNQELDDAYCYHIYCQLRLTWIRVWSETQREKVSELEQLREIANRAFRKYQRDKRIGDIKLDIERDYFALAVR